MARTTIGGTIDLAVPLVNGSGVVDAMSSAPEWNLPPEQLRKLGAFTTKTITRTPRAGNPQPWAEVIAPATLANAAGLPNPGIDAVLTDWRGLPDLLGIPIIASIGGDVADLPELARRLDDVGWASALELNLSCPNVDGGLVAADPDAAGRTVASVRARTSLPLIAKLTPACSDVATVARVVESAGADAITCSNTMPIIAVDDATGEALLGGGPRGGMSGASLLPITLRMVDAVTTAVPLPVIGLGGVTSLAAADRMRDVGASIIGVGTGAVFDPNLIDSLHTHLARPANASTVT